MREVAIKRARWCTRPSHTVRKFMATHSIPVVLGPSEQLYMVDRHHLARALLEERVREWLAMVVADYRHLEPRVFWATLEYRNWVHPFDDAGRRRAYDDLPATTADLIDDPYRSLAGALKRSGVYEKDKAPFSEFQWADFLRKRIDRQVVDKDFDLALRLASDLAEGEDAARLPGWRGGVARPIGFANRLSKDAVEVA